MLREPAFVLAIARQLCKQPVASCWGGSAWELIKSFQQTVSAYWGENEIDNAPGAHRRFHSRGNPPNDQPLQILCEDHVGTYVIPFPCRWREGLWENAKTSRRIEATVVGWRALNKT